MAGKKSNGQKMSMERARELYLKYDCNIFSMCMEDDYQDFIALKVPRETVEGWRMEKLTDLCRELEKTGDSVTYFTMCGIAEKVHGKEAPELMDRCFRHIHFETQEDRYVIAETLMGSLEVNKGLGMITWAKINDRIDVSLSLLDKVYTLIESDPKPSKNKKKIKDQFAIKQKIIMDDMRRAENR